MNAPLLEDDEHPVQKGEDGRLMFTDEEGNEVAITDGSGSRGRPRPRSVVPRGGLQGQASSSTSAATRCSTRCTPPSSVCAAHMGARGDPRLDAKLQEVRDDERELGLPRSRRARRTR